MRDPFGAVQPDATTSIFVRKLVGPQPTLLVDCGKTAGIILQFLLCGQVQERDERRSWLTKSPRKKSMPPIRLPIFPVYFKAHGAKTPRKETSKRVHVQRPARKNSTSTNVVPRALNTNIHVSIYYQQSHIDLQRPAEILSNSLERTINICVSDDKLR